MNDTEKAFQLFVSIDSGKIKADLAAAENDVSSVNVELQDLQRLRGNERTPEIECRILHLRLLQAYVISRTLGIPDEMVTFHAGVAAGAVAHASEMIRIESPKCASLLAQMEAIRSREGLSEDEEWGSDDSTPVDYQALSAEFSKLTEANIHEPVFDYMLRRYGMESIAEFHENDVEEFERHREIGMRVTWSESTGPEVMDLMNETLRKRIGEVPFQEIQARVEEIRRYLGQ